MYTKHDDYLYRAVYDLKFDEILHLDRKNISELRERVLEIFNKEYDLKEYSGKLVVSERNSGKIVRDQFYNTVTVKQAITKIAKKVQPFYGMKHEVKNLPSEHEFTKYMKKNGIPKNSQLRISLYREWIQARKDEQVKQTSDYWF